MAAQNPCAKTVKPEQAYEIWQSYDGTWTYFVLKKYQSPEKEATNPYARWYCMVRSPATTARGDVGDAYVATVKDGTYQVIHNLFALPLCFHLHAEKPSDKEGWVDCLDTSSSTLAEAQRLYRDALKTYPFVQLFIEKWGDKENDEAPMEAACLLSYGTPPLAHSPTHTDEQTTGKEH